ncbi:DUF302 domain-containing protein [Sulfurovum sp. TSL1]|uniref:DUF302 domain-containing protein n=1 Tax=Sulfurovum sp. TSL1 TaxID=2826994 RepID=UPI001CC5D609|nr:DUF302 domain-containing protein [Sulfurovum sp. TSL1]GIT99078.1 hypothetical protein TSL1_18990 [Sulfurovum sp. TSL1]
MLEALMKLLLSKKKLFEMMTYKVESTKEIFEVVGVVEPACEKYNFALLHHYVYHEVVKDKGFPIKRKVYIYEVCQAKVAALVLTEEAQFAPFMPCRVAIYEDESNVVISTQNMQMLLDTLDKNTDLYVQTNTLFNTLKSLMKDLK